MNGPNRPGGDAEDRIYRNAGNPPLVGMVSPHVRTLLDVGCGAGDNAALLRARNGGIRVVGITRSPSEAEFARLRMEECRVLDIEEALPVDLADRTFDAILFSHVLEHLRDPAGAVARFARMLAPGGEMLVAVPNVLVWSQRYRFLLGDFEYRSDGILDDTHLRFFTWRTADRYLLSKAPGLALQAKAATGSVPLWLLRRHLLPKGWSERIDAWGCARFPNLFGAQVLLKLAGSGNAPGEAKGMGAG